MGAVRTLQVLDVPEEPGEWVWLDTWRLAPEFKDLPPHFAVSLSNLIHAAPENSRCVACSAYVGWTLRGDRDEIQHWNAVSLVTQDGSATPYLLCEECSPVPPPPAPEKEDR